MSVMPVTFLPVWFFLFYCIVIIHCVVFKLYDYFFLRVCINTIEECHSLVTLSSSSITAN